MVTSRQSSQGTDFVHSRQQDTADFLTSLMGCIQSELRDGQTEYLRNLFNISMIEEFVCCLCGQTTINMVDHPFTLQIPVSHSVEHSLKIICTDELRVRNCDACGDHHAKVTTKLTSIPKIMILQILRFTSENGEQKKVIRDMFVPINLRPNADGPLYELTGAMVHLGNTTDCGHFVSIIVCPSTGKLYLCSDSAQAREVTSDELNQAYMLVYSKLDDDVRPRESKLSQTGKRINQSDMGNDITSPPVTIKSAKEYQSTCTEGVTAPQAPKGVTVEAVNQTAQPAYHNDYSHENIRKTMEVKANNILRSNIKEFNNVATIQNTRETSLINTGGYEKKYIFPNEKTLTLKLKFGGWQKICRLFGGNPLRLLNNSHSKNVCFSNVVLQCLFSLGKTYI